MKDSDLHISEVEQKEPYGGVYVKHNPTGIYAYAGVELSNQSNIRICKAMVEMGLAEIGWKDN